MFLLERGTGNFVLPLHSPVSALEGAGDSDCSGSRPGPRALAPTLPAGRPGVGRVACARLPHRIPLADLRAIHLAPWAPVSKDVGRRRRAVSLDTRAGGAPFWRGETVVRCSTNADDATASGRNRASVPAGAADGPRPTGRGRRSKMGEQYPWRRRFRDAPGARNADRKEEPSPNEPAQLKSARLTRGG